MTPDIERWQRRLTELAADRDVPGAALAIAVDGEVHTAVTGVLNRQTGVEVTPDSLFQVGSTAKVYTATATMRLVETGKLDLDAPIRDVMPEFRVADPETTARVTPRHLLTHTSGIAGDVFEDTGCGDDAVERFVARCADVGQDVPLGSTFSYSNTGFVVLGRVIERVTGEAWDDALDALVLQPLGLERTQSRLERILRFRSAYGHVGPRGQVELAPVWGLPRSASPAGATLCASASDVARFGQMFLSRGAGPDGSPFLRAETVDEMVRPQAPVYDSARSGESRGLGWVLHQWNGRTVYEHGGGTIGQRAYFEVVPDRNVVIVLLTNGRNQMAEDLYAELFAELCGLERPARLGPDPEAKTTALDGYVGTYERFGSRTDIEVRDGRVVGTDRLIEPLASALPHIDPITYELRPSTAGGNVFVSQDEGDDAWRPVAFSEIGGERYLHAGGRAQRKVR